LDTLRQQGAVYTAVAVLFVNRCAPVHKVHGYVKCILHVSVEAKVVIKHKRQGAASVVVHIGPHVASPT